MIKTDQSILIESSFKLGIFDTCKDFGDYFNKSVDWAKSVRCGRIKLSFEDAMVLMKLIKKTSKDKYRFSRRNSLQMLSEFLND